MPKVFISHSSKDKKFVRKIKDDLNENGIETWIDEDQLDIGDSLIEKIEESLEDSTHFIIVLSPHSSDSDWVKLELNTAMARISKNLIKKIIPIYYRTCVIPEIIKGLLHYDLTKENVEVIDDKVKFTTDGYPIFLNKLIKSLKSSSENKLTESDKTNFRLRLEENEKKEKKERDFIATLILQVDIYISSESREKFIKKVVDISPNKFADVKLIRPILFPRILKTIFDKITIGQEFEISSEFNDDTFRCHFAGFRRDDLHITIPAKLKQDLKIPKGKIYAIRFDGNRYQMAVVSLE